MEASINSRPLTYVEEDSNPLTPSHFLVGRSSPFSTVHTEFVPKSEKDFQLMKEEHFASLERFWNIWSEDYIKNPPSLGNGKSKMNLKIGSVVLIREEGLPRLKWPLARISEVIKSKDGLIRAVKLRTKKGELVRSVKKLHCLEVPGLESASGPSCLREITQQPVPPLNQGTLSEDSVTSVDKTLQPVSDSGVQLNTEDSGVVTSKSGRQIKPRSVLDL